MVVTKCTSFCNIQNLCTSLTKCIYVLHIILKVNYFPTQHYTACFCNGNRTFSVGYYLNFHALAQA